MGDKKLIELIKKNKKTVISIAVLFLFFVLVITFIQPLRYSATTKLLVVQSYSSATDSYSISRSNQYLGNILSQVIYSDSFYDYVMRSGFKIGQEDFSTDPIERKQQWEELVNARSLSDTGMIVITTYNQDKTVAEQFNRAIAYTLKLKHSQYHGLGAQVDIKVIDGPALSRWPVKPNILLNVSSGLVVGFALGILLVYLFPRFEFRLWRNEKVKYSEIVDNTNTQSNSYKNNNQNFKEKTANRQDIYRPMVERQSVDKALPNYNINEVDDLSIEEPENLFRGDIHNLLRR